MTLSHALTAEDAGSRFRIRPMSRPEVDFAVGLAAQEGWNPGLSDAECFYAADPEGFLLGELDGESVGCVSSVVYGDEFGFLGFYMVLPEYRHRGFGMRLTQAAIARFHGQPIGIDGVFERQQDYAGFGFQFAYRNLRFACPASAIQQGGGAPRDGLGVVPIESADAGEIAALDRMCFPAERSRFLDAWFAAANHLALACVRDARLLAYGTIRPCTVGYKIGPLFAFDADAADAVLVALVADVPPDEQVFLDVPEANEAAMSLARRYGMDEVFGTARMYLNRVPHIDVDKVFGVTTFELG